MPPRVPMTQKYTPSMSPEAVEEKTGQTWDGWFAMLDRWGATGKPHKDIAEYLQERHGQTGWWAQTIAVEYERARGLREVGQTSAGTFAVSAQRTLAVDVETAKAWWVDADKRQRWLDDEVLGAAIEKGMRETRTSKTAMGDTMRFDIVPSGGDRKQVVQVTFSDKGDRTEVRVQHDHIASKDERDVLKERWGPVLDVMKKRVEAPN